MGKGEYSLYFLSLSKFKPFLQSGRDGMPVPYNCLSVNKHNSNRFVKLEFNLQVQYRRSAPLDECARKQNLNRCYFFTTLSDSVTKIGGTADKAASLVFFFVNCEYSPVEISVSGTFLNPDNNHASTGIFFLWNQSDLLQKPNL